MKLYGVKVGKNFYCEATPKLKLKGKASNIIIGENVKFLGEVDLRNRESGRIILRDNSSLETGVRLVAAREGIIDIGEDTSIGPHTIINGGGNVIIGKKCLFAKNISINANDHMYDKILPIKEQGFIHKDVLIEDDVWLGANVCVNKGIIIKKGSVVGANAVVTKNTSEYSISAGVPAKQLSFRG